MMSTWSRNWQNLVGNGNSLGDDILLGQLAGKLPGLNPWCLQRLSVVSRLESVHFLTLLKYFLSHPNFRQWIS